MDDLGGVLRFFSSLGHLLPGRVFEGLGFFYPNCLLLFLVSLSLSLSLSLSFYLFLYLFHGGDESSWKSIKRRRKYRRAAVKEKESREFCS